VVGQLWPEWGVKMKPLGDAFINLIKMMIAPIIFCTIVTGVAGMGSMKQVGKVGAKALICFEVITTAALIIGLVLVEFIQPGKDLKVNLTEANVDAVKQYLGTSSGSGGGTSVDFFMHIIPSTLMGALTSGDILQVLLVALLFAASMPALGNKGPKMLDFLNMVSHLLFKMVDFITHLAPLGAFGAMAFSVGTFGIGSLKDLGELVLIFYITCALFIILIMWPIMQLYCGLSTWKFLKFIREEIFIVLGTSSSESVLTRLMEKLEHMGCSRPVVGMVVPTGYSFNLVGSSIYFTMGALFIAYATHTHISLGEQLTLLGILLIASKGAAGVSGSAFIILAATLSSMKIIPQQNLDVGLALIFAVDRFMSTGRAITNLIGNGITTVVVAKWENALDMKRAQKALDEGTLDL